MNSVSVVVPTYNRADFLPLTIESILRQTVPPQEIVVVDDGSTDDTAAVCARFPSKTVRTIHQQNSGLPAARNRGIAASSGDWLALCDSDDVWARDKLEVQLAALAAHPAAKWCISECRLVDGSGVPVPTKRTGFEGVFAAFHETGRSPEEHFRLFLSEHHTQVCSRSIRLFVGDAYGMLFYGNVALPSSALMARDLLERTGPFDPAFPTSEETEFFHRAAAASPVVIVDDPLVDYRVGHTSMMSTLKATSFMETTLISLDRAAALRPELSDVEQAAYRWGAGRQAMLLAEARLADGDRSGARAALQLARMHRAAPLRRALFWLMSLAPGSVLRGGYAVRRFVGRLVRR